MNADITMSVSAMTRSKDSKAVYVFFQDENRSAELSLPECKVLKNDGFDEGEIQKLCEYVDSERDVIYNMAKQINPVKALMK
ncbi:MAG: hypothetical protein IK078_07330 [Lachnospiraceae bacterium]|nr:hypothetical protein [Lachnospiraceae bacterium]